MAATSTNQQCTVGALSCNRAGLHQNQFMREAKGLKGQIKTVRAKMSADLLQICNRGPCSSVKAEALLQHLLQPGWQAGRHTRGAPFTIAVTICTCERSA